MMNYWQIAVIVGVVILAIIFIPPIRNAICGLFPTQNTNEPRLEKNEINGATNEQLTKIISELTTALKKAEEEREILKKQMEDLRYQGAINREQTKFLTANVYRSGNSSLL